jgi:hypothetical protein
MTQEHRKAQALPLDEWEDTKETLYRYCQIVGKMRMGLSPFKNYWWHATLYITTRGLSAGPIPYGKLELRHILRPARIGPMRNLSYPTLGTCFVLAR